MDIIFSTINVVDRKRPREVMLNLKQADFENVLLDLNLFCPFAAYKKNTLSDISADYIEEVTQDPTCIRGWMKNIFFAVKDSGLNVSIFRSAFIYGDAELTYRLTLESINICHDNGVEYLAIPSEMANYEYVINIGKIAHDNSVYLLFVNEYKEYNGHYVRGFGTNGKEFSNIIRKFNSALGADVFGICVDIGVCNLCGQNTYEYITDVKEYIKGIILTDSDGHNDVNMLPFSCSFSGISQTDYLGIVRSLREIMFEGLLIINMSDTYMAFPPMLRSELLKLARKTAEYFKWQTEIEKSLSKYSKRVLFGAGNMCRNYMKCYGEKYPPLFTCDNNKKMWGSNFCGLEVKNPEELRMLSDDCAVFICNVYYSEIEKQLRDMGINNPIEYFNDEYMQTFYF